MYDFHTSRESFDAWVENHRFDGLEGPNIGPATILAYDAASDSSRHVEFEEAILYSWNDEDAGVNFLYDPADERAYYFSHTR